MDYNRETLTKAKKIFNALDHKIRAQILVLLSGRSMNVTEIWTELRLEQSVISSHLGMLRDVRVIRAERNGKYIQYHINQKVVEQYQQLAIAVHAVALENKPFTSVNPS